jgi:biotin carboxyl carrier protein
MSQEFFRCSGKKFTLASGPEAKFKLEQRPGGWIVLEDPQTGLRKRVFAWEGRTRLAFSVSGKLWAGEVQRKSRAAGGAAGAGDSDLTAQFPGKVRKLLVDAGTPVEAGQPLLLIEAMKMEFAIKAPSRGQVRKFLVEVGQQLSPGMTLVDFVGSEG